MKRHVDRKHREVEKWNKVMLSIKNLVFKKRPVKKIDREIHKTIYIRVKVIV